MAISFNQIPNDSLVPFFFTEFNNAGATTGPTLLSYTSLVFGQMLASGSAPPEKEVLVTKGLQDGLFGVGSQLAKMFDAWFLNNKTGEVHCIPSLDNAAGVKAKGTIVFTGPATADGTLALYFGGYRLQIAISNSDSATTIGDAVEAAVNADPLTMVTAANAIGSVAFEFVHKGIIGNEFRLNESIDESESLPAGVGAVITQMGVTVAGTTVPAFAPVIAEMGDRWYQILAFPFVRDTTTFNLLNTEMEDRFGPIRQLDGKVTASIQDAHGTLVTFGTGKNSLHFSVKARELHDTPPWVHTAADAAIYSRFGSIDPARPFQTLPKAGVLSPPESDRFTFAERNILLKNGLATDNVDTGGTTRIERALTTWQKNAAGAPDTTYRDIQTGLTLQYLRFDWNAFMQSKYPRHKLAKDGTRFGEGQAVMTPKLGKSEMVARFKLWEGLGLVEDVDAFKGGLVVEINAGDSNRLDFLAPPDLIGQLRVVGTQLAFLL